MKQLFDINKTISHAKAAVRLYARDLGEPVRLTDTECSVVFANIQQDTLNPHRAYLVVDFRKNDITFTHNTEGVLGIKNLTLEKFSHRIHPDYVGEYINWAIAAYQLASQKAFEPIKERYRILLPIQVSSKKYYWFMQDSVALQVDENGKVVSYLNYIDIIRPFQADEKLPLKATIFNGTTEMVDWNAQMESYKFSVHPFVLTDKQREIINFFLNNPSASNDDVAHQLHITKETANTHNRQIIARARDAFPTVVFTNLKSVIVFIGSLGLLLDNNLLDKDK